jgi:hypothetical protein
MVGIRGSFGEDGAGLVVVFVSFISFFSFFFFFSSCFRFSVAVLSGGLGPSHVLVGTLVVDRCPGGQRFFWAAKSIFLVYGRLSIYRYLHKTWNWDHNVGSVKTSCFDTLVTHSGRSNIVIS